MGNGGKLHAPLSLIILSMRRTDRAVHSHLHHCDCFRFAESTGWSMRFSETYRWSGRSGQMQVVKTGQYLPLSPSAFEATATQSE